MKRIKENWNEIERIEDNGREKSGDPEAGFNANLFFLGGPRQILLPILYRKKKRNGEGWTQKRYELMVPARFCPFTGKPLYSDEEE